MALPSLVTEEAAADVTAQVSASPDVNDFGSYDTNAENFDEPCAARHNRALRLTGPDGTYDWRNDATGFFD